MDTKLMMAHLAELQENNTREWYHQHKAQRLAVAASFEELVAALELEIMAFDPAYSFHPPAELTFKQVRDVRFSKDKTHIILRCGHISGRKANYRFRWVLCQAGTRWRFLYRCRTLYGYLQRCDSFDPATYRWT